MPLKPGKSRAVIDDGDALALTFAAHVAPIEDDGERDRYGSAAGSWMG